MIIRPLIGAIERTGPGADTGARTGIRIELTVPKDLYYFQGHFPGQPLLPGVVQVAWAMELAGEYLPSVNSRTFQGLSAIKFMRVIEPGASVTLDLTFDADKQRLSFDYFSAAGSYSSGAAQFAQ
jgi:3-hydroxymyristoyl/3-hydroxydecanoyl-(acyl carrier protein) dehydratase